MKVWIKRWVYRSNRWISEGLIGQIAGFTGQTDGSACGFTNMKSD